MTRLCLSKGPSSCNWATSASCGCPLLPLTTGPSHDIPRARSDDHADGVGRDDVPGGGDADVDADVIHVLGFHLSSPGGVEQEWGDLHLVPARGQQGSPQEDECAGESL